MPSSYCPSDCGVQHITSGERSHEHLSMLRSIAGSFTSGMLGEKMSAYEQAAAAGYNNAVDVPEYKGSVYLSLSPLTISPLQVHAP